MYDRRETVQVNELLFTLTPYRSWTGDEDSPQKIFRFIIPRIISVWPNPFIANKHATIFFGSKKQEEGKLVDGTSIRIFTLLGELVKTLTAKNGIAEWDTRNEDEKEVASGIYIYLIDEY